MLASTLPARVIHIKDSITVPNMLKLWCTPEFFGFRVINALQLISSQQMQRGFKHLVGAAADLKLDVPDAAAQIATFIARAVIDDVLPPAFVDDLSAGEPQHG